MNESTNKFQVINFNELLGLNDSEAIVMTEVLIPESVEEKEAMLKEINDDFKLEGFLKDGEVIDIRTIKGNVNEESGDYRIDSLLVLSSGTVVHHIKRIGTYPFIKWISDFVANCRKDYAIG